MIDKKYDIVAVGESLIDFVAKKSEDGTKLLLEGNPGGAPANVLAGAAKLGLKTALLSKLGKDSFGEFLKDSLERANVDTDGVRFTDKHPTSLAFVTLDENGDRSFQFYRDHTADLMLKKEDLDLEKIRTARLFHFGSVSMSADPARGATLAAASYAREQGIPVSYDPNLRVRLWDNLDEAKHVILDGMKLAQYVKVSEEELQFLTGENDLENGALKLFKDYPMELLFVTLGPKGCMVCADNKLICANTYDVPCVDTTGAGDAFWAAILYKLLSSQKPVKKFAQDDFTELLNFANAAGSLATTKQGAIPSLPCEKEILHCMQTVSFLLG